MTPSDKRTRINRRALESPDPASFKLAGEDAARLKECVEQEAQQTSNVVYLFSPKTLPLRVRRPRKG